MSAANTPPTPSDLPVEAEIRAEDLEAEAEEQDAAVEADREQTEKEGAPGAGENAPGFIRPLAR
jgi:hypothetical protein